MGYYSFFISSSSSVNANKSSFEILTGTLGEQNITTYLPFPDGYNSTNCMTISMMVYVSSDYIGNAINQDWVYISFDSSRIIVVVKDAGVTGKTFKLLLYKTK